MDSLFFCQETWLADIVDIALYRKKSSFLPIPQAIRDVTDLNNVTFNDFIVGFAYVAQEGYVLAADASITAKISSSVTPSGRVYQHDIAVSVSDFDSDLYNIEGNIGGEDCLVVLTCQDETVYLCYTLDGTFDYKCVPSRNNGVQNSINISLKSCSRWIKLPITP